jgi:hypothetical protein
MTISPAIRDAFFIGFFAGIIIYSVAANTWGLVTLIPLFFIYALLKRGKGQGSAVVDKEEVEQKIL